MSLIPKNLAFYIDVGLSTKKACPKYPISDKTVVMMAIDMDYVLLYGMGKLEHDRFLKSLGGLFG